MTERCVDCDGEMWEDEAVERDDGLCRRCGAIADGELHVCGSCGEDVDEVDDEGACGQCLAEAEHLRQLHSDYYASRI